MHSLFRLGAAICVASLALPLSLDAQSRVKHRAYSTSLKSSEDRLSKSGTVDPSGFNLDLPLGFPRNGVSWEIQYIIPFQVDNLTENIDYFAFSAPSGWTITAIGAAPALTACQDNPHTSVISGFSATSAYWGGDYGGGVVTPGTPATYPDLSNRSSCGPFATAMSPAAADTHTFSITMTPNAPGECPGSTTGALPLCCGLSEVTAGGPPPLGSEPYFNEMQAASDTNATIFGDAYYYVNLSCPPPQLNLVKFPMDAPVNGSDCAAAFPQPDTLVVPTPPGEDTQSCYFLTNFSNIFTDPWAHTACDSTSINDDPQGLVWAEPFALQPGETLITPSDSVASPSAGECAQNVAQGSCTTTPGSDYINGLGIQDNITFTQFSVPDSAWVCAVSSLPVVLTHFGARTDNRDLLLTWTTASETGNSGFAVEHRIADDVAFKEVGFVEGAGTSREQNTYSFRIADPGPGRHAVRLKQIDLDGAVTYSPVVLTEIEVPGEYFLTAPYPNPFTASATVEFAVPASQDVRLELIDVQGRPVRTLFDGSLEANARRKVRFAATGLASGTYFLRLTGESFQASEKVTIAR